MLPRTTTCILRRNLMGMSHAAIFLCLYWLAAAPLSLAQIRYVDPPPPSTSVSRPFVSGREMTETEARVLADDPGYADWGEEFEDGSVDAATAEYFFNQMRQWAAANNPADLPVTLKLRDSGGYIEGGSVYFTDDFGNPLYEATFDSEGKTTGAGRTSWGAVSDFLDRFTVPGSGHRVFSYARDVSGALYVSSVTVTGEGAAALQANFNEHGEPYAGTRTNADGEITNDWSGANPGPEYGDGGEPLRAKDMQPFVSGACAECEPSQLWRNDIATVMNDIAVEMNALAVAHAESTRIGEDLAISAQDLPAKRGRYDFLNAVWQRLSLKLKDADADLRACQKTLCRRGEDLTSLVDQAVTAVQALGGISGPVIGLVEDSPTFCTYDSAGPVPAGLTPVPTAQPPITPPSGTPGQGTTTPPGGVPQPGGNPTQTEAPTPPPVAGATDCDQLGGWLDALLGGAADLAAWQAEPLVAAARAAWESMKYQCPEPPPGGSWLTRLVDRHPAITGEDLFEELSAPKTPCEERLDALNAEYLKLVQAARTLANKGQWDSPAYTQVENAIEELAGQIETLEEICDENPDTIPAIGKPLSEDAPPNVTTSTQTTADVPENGADEGPGTEETPQSPEPTMTLIVKARSSVLQSGANVASATRGQQIKLIPDTTTQMALPSAGGMKNASTGHDQPPIQGTTGADGNVALHIPLDDAGWFNGGDSGPWSGTGAINALADSMAALNDQRQTLTQGVCEVLSALGHSAAVSCSPLMEVVDHQIGSFLGTFAGTFETEVNTETVSSVNVEAAADLLLDANLTPYTTGSLTIADRSWITLTFPASLAADVQTWIDGSTGVVSVSENVCRDKQADSRDSYRYSTGSWGQSYADQWALDRIGLDTDTQIAMMSDLEPVIVAVIDTGLDWHHQDFDWRNLWRNDREIPDNGRDDDGNGYVDDVIGWDFYDKDNHPWDHDGHGTIVTGIIAADTSNGSGIAGVAPNARIMVLRALNSFGHSRASYLASALVYAADNGARVVNMSVGGPGITDIEQAAIDYAWNAGVTIIVASGNEAVDTTSYGVAASDRVLTVAATSIIDERSAYSNHGRSVDIAAPGDDILSLRARYTDTMRDIPGVNYVPGSAFVGADKRHYRASGTSFAAPLVSGVAALVLGTHPHYSPADVHRVITQSATDLASPGVDPLTGYGLVNAPAALSAPAGFFTTAWIDRVEVVQENGALAVAVYGSADADQFARATLSIGSGDSPRRWLPAGGLGKPVTDDRLGSIEAGKLAGSAQWTIQLEVEHASGATRKAWYRLDLQQ